MSDTSSGSPSGDANPGEAAGASTRPDATRDAASVANPDEAANGSSVSEPRVAQLVRGQVREEELDPVTAAQLAAWFGAPAAAMDAPSEQAEDREDSHAKWSRARRERERHVEASLDERLARRLEAWTEQSQGLTRLPPPICLGIEREISYLDMSVWRVRSVEITERMRPEDINDGLQESVPQAILRDLHRPIMSWPFLMMNQEVGMDIAGARSIERIRETASTSYRVRMGEELIASALVQKDMSELAASLDEPWDEIEIPEEQRSTSSLERTREDILWFGGVGYDPTI